MLTPYISSMNVVFSFCERMQKEIGCVNEEFRRAYLIGIHLCITHSQITLHTFMNRKKNHTHTQENETEREKKNQAKREIIYMCYWCGSKFRKGFSNNLTKSAFRGAYRYTQPTISKYVFLFVK